MMENTPENPQGNPEPVPAPEVNAQPVNQKLCGNCGTLNASDAKFCYKCGQALPEPAAVSGKKICAGCNTANDASSIYCLKCGLKLPEVSPTNAPLKYGGFWIRLGAIIIDTLILSTVTSIITSPFYLPVLSKMMDWLKSISSYAGDDPFYVFDQMVNSDWYRQMILISFLAGIIQTAAYCAYYSVGVGKWGTTIGKTACGLKVVRTDGSRVSYGRAFARYWARVLNGITCGITYLVIAFSAKKQGIHDMMCDTLVVKKN